MSPNVRPDHRAAYDAKVDADSAAGHGDLDTYRRWVRQRRLSALAQRLEAVLPSARELSVLVVCGGTGGECRFLRQRGYAEVTNSDFSEAALRRSRELDPTVQTMLVDLEANDVPDGSFDIVLVQDGLHHLTRPVNGLNEMIRMARVGVAMAEPRDGLSGRLLGRAWEEIGGTRNYVFRWSDSLFRQTLRAQLLTDPATEWVAPIWDHDLTAERLSSWLSKPDHRQAFTQTMYTALLPFKPWANNFLAVASW